MHINISARWGSHHWPFNGIAILNGFSFAVNIAPDQVLVFSRWVLHTLYNDQTMQACKWNKKTRLRESAGVHWYKRKIVSKHREETGEKKSFEKFRTEKHEPFPFLNSWTTKKTIIFNALFYLFFFFRNRCTSECEWLLFLFSLHCANGHE